MKKYIPYRVEIVAAEKLQAFANIGPTRNTVAERISEVAGDVDRQLMDKVISFVAFLVAIDESMMFRTLLRRHIHLQH